MSLAGPVPADVEPRTAPARSWTVLAAVVVGVLIPAYLVTPEGWVTELDYLAVTCGAAAWAWIGALRQQGLARRVGLALAAGLTLSSIGDGIWSVWSLTQDSVPDVSVADVFWFGSYVAIAAGLFEMLRGEQRRLDVDGLIDVAAVSVMALLVQWQLVIGTTLGDDTLPPSTRLAWSMYPALDAVLLALVVRLVASGRASSRAGAFVAGGATFWLVSDLAYNLNGGEETRWSALGWLVGAVSFALGAWGRPGGGLSPSHQTAADEPVAFGRVAVALLPLLVPGTIELVTYLQGTDPNPVPLLVATAILVGLAYLRTVRVLQAAQSARALLDRERRFASTVAENASDAVAIVDADVKLLRDAPQLAGLVGVQLRSNRGLSLLSFVDPDHLGNVQRAVDRCLSSPGTVFEIEVPVRHASGRPVWFRVRIVNRLADPDVQGIVLNLHDVTDRKAVEDELTRQAFHDGLTGLPNRVLFIDRVDHALRRAGRSGTQPALIYLDLDGFKHVNDSLGHSAGDHLLRRVGDRLLASLRAGDTVARLGGDEFAILLEESSRPEQEATALAERIVHALTIPVELGDRMVTVSASVGIAVGDSDATALTLLRDADVAMYQAKTAGKARWIVYDGEMRSAAVERLELENDLRVALAGDELVLEYQPVIELSSSRVIGFEALVRWEHPRLGRIPPDRFIPIAEQTGQIGSIGRWVLETACTTAKGWQERFPGAVPLTMAVNVSGDQLADPTFAAQVASALTRTGLPPSSLVLEITESVLVRDPTAVAGRLQELHRLGLRLAIDDFGTGYSSLSYLRQFPIDILKIDQSFVQTITDREQVPAIVRGLLDLGRTLDLETVAEGIEVDVQHAALRDERCSLGQGFLFARPLPAGEVEQLLIDVDQLAADQLAADTTTA